MVQLSTPTPSLSATIHIVTDRQTDRQRRQYYANSQVRSPNTVKNCEKHLTGSDHIKSTYLHSVT